MYVVGGKLLKAVRSFYVYSRACVRVGMDMSEWFPLNVGLRHLGVHGFGEGIYDTIDRHDMWRMQRVYGLGGILLNALQSFYVDSRSCVWIGMDVSE